MAKEKKTVSIGDDLSKALLDLLGENDEHQEVKYWLDTGYPPLNRAVSGSYYKGVPVGRMIEIFGPPSSGKCQPASTMTLGEHGMVTIGELFELCGYKPVVASKDVEHSVGLLNERGEIEQTSHLTWNGRKAIKRIVGESGMFTEATLRHPLRVINEHGWIVWKHAGDIRVGDYLVAMRGTNAFGTGSLSTDEAKLIGYLIADGSLNNSSRISFSNSDVEIEAEFKRLMSVVAPTVDVKTRSKIGTGTVDHYINNTALRAEMERRYDLKLAKAAFKSVPLCVRQAGRDAQVAFLRGYFELECSVNANKGVIEVTSASSELIRQIQLMLLNLGILSRSAPKRVDGYEHVYTRLTIGSYSAREFLKIVGFETTARRDVVEQMGEMKRETSVDCIPNIHDLIRSLYDTTDTDREGNRLCEKFMLAAESERSRGLNYGALSEIIDYFAKNERENLRNKHILEYLGSLSNERPFFDRVVSIEDGEEPTFDVCLPETHSFWANGYISHNTAIATNIMVAAQKAGGIAMYNDHERSFDVGLAATNGLNTKRPYWIFKTPETFEKSIADSMNVAQVIRDSKGIPDEAPIVIVFDSLASMIPKSKFESKDGKGKRGVDEYNMNDTTALARATSNVFPALAQWCEKYNVCVIFLNQARTKIGVMYGDPTTTPGGQAPEFYCSVRIKLGKRTIEKGTGEDKEVTGQRVGAQCIKNKVSRPFRKASWNFMFNEDGTGGFDNVGSLVDYLKELKLLKESGAYIEWSDGKKYHRGPLIEKIKSEGLYEELLKYLPDDRDAEEIEPDPEGVFFETEDAINEYGGEDDEDK